MRILLITLLLFSAASHAAPFQVEKYCHAEMSEWIYDLTHIGPNTGHVVSYIFTTQHGSNAANHLWLRHSGPYYGAICITDHSLFNRYWRSYSCPSVPQNGTSSITQLLSASCVQNGAASLWPYPGAPCRPNGGPGGSHDD